jgi:hypothetical protein
LKGPRRQGGFAAPTLLYQTALRTGGTEYLKRREEAAFRQLRARLLLTSGEVI